MKEGQSQPKLKVTFENRSELPEQSAEELKALLGIILNLDIEGECNATLHRETLCIVLKKGGVVVRNFCQQVASAESGTLQPLRLEEVSGNLMQKLGKKFTSKTIGEPEAANA